MRYPANRLRPIDRDHPQIKQGCNALVYSSTCMESTNSSGLPIACSASRSIVRSIGLDANRAGGGHTTGWLSGARWWPRAVFSVNRCRCQSSATLTAHGANQCRGARQHYDRRRHYLTPTDCAPPARAASSSASLTSVRLFFVPLIRAMGSREPKSVYES
jgi:hypothetical protein